MAIARFINGTKGKGGKPVRYRTLGSVKRLINYVLRVDKTMDALRGGIYCNPDTAYEEFLLTKAMHHKLPEGNLSKHDEVIHMILGLKGYEATPELAKRIAEELLRYEQFQVFQVVYAVHTDTDNLHVHFAINSVNYETGRRWHITNNEVKKVIERSNEICESYHLSKVKLREQSSYREGSRRLRQLSSGEYRARRDGRSWKAETLYAGMAAKKIAESREEFIEIMAQVGYQVIWKDSRKNVTFITPQGKKINSDKLGYPGRSFLPLTKEALEKQFALNRQIRENDNRFVVKHQDKVSDLINLAHKLTENSPQAQYPFQKAVMQSGRKEGQALKDLITELEKGQGIDWERD